MRENLGTHMRGFMPFILMKIRGFPPEDPSVFTLISKLHFYYTFFEEISRSLRSNVLHFPLNVCATPPQIRKKVIIFPI